MKSGGALTTYVKTESCYIQHFIVTMDHVTACLPDSAVPLSSMDL